MSLHLLLTLATLTLVEFMELAATDNAYIQSVS